MPQFPWTHGFVHAKNIFNLSFSLLVRCFFGLFSALLSKKASMGIFLLSHPGWGGAGEQGKGWWFLVFSWGF